MRKHHKEYEEQKDKTTKCGLWYQRTGVESIHFQKWNNFQKKIRNVQATVHKLPHGSLVLPKVLILLIFLSKQILLFHLFGIFIFIILFSRMFLSLPKLDVIWMHNTYPSFRTLMKASSTWQIPTRSYWKSFQFHHESLIITFWRRLPIR